MKAGPAVTAVAKIQIASNADSGTATIAMIFERIDQLRLLIKLRQKGFGRERSADHPWRRPP
ncbi:hypothetical protein Axi01nite_52070 [Actinoplanes xinjiangensis]|nr:hypothetical protein Axi01nite_52070 [Actinoplanes xinjiangensis]